MVGIGTYLFFHYYGLLNYEDRNDSSSDLNADIRVLKLQDVDTRQEYEFSVDLRNLDEDQTNMILNWHSKNWVLVLEVGKDPADMTDQESRELFERVMEAIKNQLNSATSVNEIEIVVLDAYSAAERTIRVKLSLVSGEDIAVIAEYQGTSGMKALVYFEGNPDQMNDQSLSELYVKIAQAIRNLEQTSVVLTLKDAKTSKTLSMAIYRGEVSEDVLTKLLKLTDAVVVDSLPADPTVLDVSARETLIEEICAAVINAQTVRYTLLLRDADTGVV